MVRNLAKIEDCIFVKARQAIPVLENHLYNLNGLVVVATQNANANEEILYLVKSPLVEVDVVAGDYYAGQALYFNPSNLNQPADNSSISNLNLAYVYQNATSATKVLAVFISTQR